MKFIYLLIILGCTFAGGFKPMTQSIYKSKVLDYPLGEPFTSGVFLALSLAIMLPASWGLMGKAFPVQLVPLAPIAILVTYTALLAIEQYIGHLHHSKSTQNTVLIPLIMTLMIAIPSFLLGVALGVSPPLQALVIFFAIIIHKSSAAFALALKMKRSSLSSKQAWIAFCLFAVSTPLGILFAPIVHSLLSSDGMIVFKGIILGMAAGTFLYMATINEFKDSALIKYCGSLKGLSVFVLGIGITLIVRLLIGEAPHI